MSDWKFDADGIEQWYFTKTERFAARRMRWVPEVGDEVRFKGICYKVTGRVWVMDESSPRVHLEITNE